MKNIVILDVIIFIFFCFNTAFAELLPEFLKKETTEVSIEASSFRYKESTVMKQKGPMYGVSLAKTYHIPYTAKTDRSLMFKWGGIFKCGYIDYQNSSNIENEPSYIWEVRGLAGHDFPVSVTYVITPYIGVGYRYLNNDSSYMVSSSEAWGYERESNYLYIPIGIEVIPLPLPRDWSIGGILEYDYLVKGKQVSHLSDVIAYYNDPINHQNNGYGLRGAIKIQKKGENIDLLIEPFIRYWNIKKSETVDLIYANLIIGTVTEPHNISTDIGIKCDINF